MMQEYMVASYQILKSVAGNAMTYKAISELVRMTSLTILPISLTLTQYLYTTKYVSSLCFSGCQHLK